MSMQPMFTIQSSASSSLTSGKSIRRRCGGLSRVEASNRARRDPVGHVLRRVLLEEELAVPAVGIALHRERPVLQVRHEHGRDVAVVREQVALRDPLLGPERLVEVRQLEHARAAPDLRPAAAPARGAPPRPPCPRAGPGRPAPAAGRRASTRRTRPRRRARARPRRRRPCAPAASSAPRRTATSSRSSGFSSASSRVDLGVVEAGADVAGPAEAAALVDAEHERAEAVRAAPLPLRVARRSTNSCRPCVLIFSQLRRAPARLVARVGPLGHDPLEPLLPCAASKSASPSSNASETRTRPVAPVEQRLEPLAPLRERQVDERLAVDLEHVEDA